MVAVLVGQQFHWQGALVQLGSRDDKGFQDLQEPQEQEEIEVHPERRESKDSR